jgi:hypothetical protein
VTAEGGVSTLLPSSVPSSLYCELNGENGGARPGGGGSAWKSGWGGLTVETLGTIDSVSRCSLGRIGAVLEHSGVFFFNDDYSVLYAHLDAAKVAIAGELLSRGEAVQAATGYREAAGYFTPLVFYCREDYVLYWSLLIGFRGVYGEGPLREVFTTQNPLTMASPGDDVAAITAYWIRFVLLGVDCLGAIPGNTTTIKCGGDDTTPHATVPFLPNVSVGLDIGQFFRGLDLPGVLYGSTEDSVISIDDPDGRVRDYLWAFSSLRRRSPDTAASGCVPGFYGSSTHGFCVNRTFFDSQTALISGNGLNSKTVPNGPATAKVWPNGLALVSGGRNPGTHASSPPNFHYKIRRSLRTDVNISPFPQIWYRLTIYTSLRLRLRRCLFVWRRLGVSPGGLWMRSTTTA